MKQKTEEGKKKSEMKEAGKKPEVSVELKGLAGGNKMVILKAKPSQFQPGTGEKKSPSSAKAAKPPPPKVQPRELWGHLEAPANPPKPPATFLSKPVAPKKSSLPALESPPAKRKLSLDENPPLAEQPAKKQKVDSAKKKEPVLKNTGASRGASRSNPTEHSKSDPPTKKSRKRKDPPKSDPPPPSAKKRKVDTDEMNTKFADELVQTWRDGKSPSKKLMRMKWKVGSLRIRTIWNLAEAKRSKEQSKSVTQTKIRAKPKPKISKSKPSNKAGNRKLKEPIPSVNLDLKSSPIPSDKEPPDAASVDLSDSLDEVGSQSLDNPPERLGDILNEDDDDEYEEVKFHIPVIYKDQYARAELLKTQKVVVQGLISDTDGRFLEFHHGNPNHKYVGRIHDVVGTQLFFTEDQQSLGQFKYLGKSEREFFVTERKDKMEEEIPKKSSK